MPSQALIEWYLGTDSTNGNLREKIILINQTDFNFMLGKSVNHVDDFERAAPLFCLALKDCLLIVEQ